MIRVAVVDDQALVRRGFCVLVGSDPDLEVVGEAGDGEAAVDLVRATRPDVVLMDIRMPGTDGLTATRRIAADPELVGTRVLVLTTFDRDDYVISALRDGASGFLLKDADPDVLLDAIRIVAAGDALLAPRATRVLVEEYLGRRGPVAVGGGPGSVPGVDALTEREREVLALVAHGRSNAEIAEELVLGQATVKTHVSHLLAKLAARDRAGLVVAAYESGLVRPGRG